MTKLILTRDQGLLDWCLVWPNNYLGPTVSPGRYLNIDQGTRLVPWQLFISIVTPTLINKLISYYHYYANLASGGSLRYRKYLDTDFTFIIKPTMPSFPEVSVEHSTTLSQCINISFFFQVSIQSDCTGWWMPWYHLVSISAMERPNIWVESRDVLLRLL